MSALSRRDESRTRYVAARKAQTITASTPPKMEVGLTQLDHGSPPPPPPPPAPRPPPAPPAGTRPDAIAPATVPMKKGTSTDEMANAAPKFRRSRVRNTA